MGPRKQYNILPNRRSEVVEVLHLILMSLYIQLEFLLKTIIIPHFKEQEK